jgi:hypothetical protein
LFGHGPLQQQEGLKLTSNVIVKKAEKDPDEILRPQEIEKEVKVSWKTIARAHPDKVLHLGKRARGMRRGDALGR